MRILDPELVPDVSIWCDHINAKEFEDGGCQSVIVGLYSVTDGTGKRVLSPTSRKQCQAVAATSMILQAYYWDDITLNSVEQANWVLQTIQAEGLPIKWIWADQEQWWSDWGKWNQWRAGKIPVSEVPVANPAAISLHNEYFIKALHAGFPSSGVYTNKGFVASWAAGMDAWLPQYRAWVAQYGRQPHVATQMTWAEFKANWMPDYDIILSAGQKPDMVVGHQFTGDVCILPGAYTRYGALQALDVSVFSKVFIDSLRPSNPIPAPIPILPPGHYPPLVHPI